MTSISKNVFIYKLADIFNEYNNTHQSTIKLKLIDAKSSMYIDFSIESNDKDPKFEVYDGVSISKYKNIFVKSHTPNWSEEVFVIKNVKITMSRTHVIKDINGKKIVETFYEEGIILLS